MQDKLDNAPIRFEKGYYIRTMYMVYTHFMDTLLDYHDDRYDTYEEALKHIYDDIEETYEIWYHDGNDNWYHCISVGHDRFDNDLLIKRLQEGDPCLSKGYYTIYTRINEKAQDPFDIHLRGYHYHYREKVYDNIEDLISDTRLLIDEEKDRFYDDRYYDHSKYKRRVYYIDEDDNIKEVFPSDFKKKTSKI